MKISYDTSKDLLYIRFDVTEQKVDTICVNDNIIIELGDQNKLVGIEVLDASTAIALDQLFPVLNKIIGAGEPLIQKAS